MEAIAIVLKEQQDLMETQNLIAKSGVKFFSNLIINFIKFCLYKEVTW